MDSNQHESEYQPNVHSEWNNFLASEMDEQFRNKPAKDTEAEDSEINSHWLFLVGRFYEVLVKVKAQVA
jgi:hypothetical protein